MGPLPNGAAVEADVVVQKQHKLRVNRHGMNARHHAEDLLAAGL
jgi:hypothetical protein